MAVFSVAAEGGDLVMLVIVTGIILILLIINTLLLLRIGGKIRGLEYDSPREDKRTLREQVEGIDMDKNYSKQELKDAIDFKEKEMKEEKETFEKLFIQLEKTIKKKTVIKTIKTQHHYKYYEREPYTVCAGTSFWTGDCNEWKTEYKNVRKTRQINVVVQVPKKVNWIFGDC